MPEPLKSANYLKDATYLAHYFADREQEYRFKIRELEGKVARLERRQDKKTAKREKVIEEVGQGLSDSYGLYSLEDSGFKLVGKISIMNFKRTKFEKGVVESCNT